MRLLGERFSAYDHDAGSGQVGVAWAWRCMLVARDDGLGLGYLWTWIANQLVGMC
jgi:hypothetical protein